MHRSLAEVIEAFADASRSSTRPEDRKLAHDCIAALAPLLASAVLGKDLLRALPELERLFGSTRWIDTRPFEPALAKWRQFRREYEEFALSGMTVNERLAALGTLAAFDRARSCRDTAEMERLLTQAYVDTPSMRKIIDNT
jgi:hypothetical protein